MVIKQTNNNSKTPICEIKTYWMDLAKYRWQQKGSVNLKIEQGKSSYLKNREEKKFKTCTKSSVPVGNYQNI